MKNKDIPLQLSGLGKTFKTGFLNLKKVHAVKELSFSLKKGEIFGLLGPNGAGKTTTLKMATGLIHPDRGEIQIFGKTLDKVSSKRRLGFLPENPWFYDYLTAEEFLKMAGGLFGINKETTEKRSKALLHKLGIAHASNRPLRKFSKGMLQRAGLAQALINDPDLIILDEPLSGLDPIGRKELRDIILDLKRNGKTVLFSSHILSDVEELCDRVAIISKGELKEIGTLDALLESGISDTDIDVSCKPHEIKSFLEKHKDITYHETITGMKLQIGSNILLQDILKDIIDLNIKLIKVVPHRRSLEDIFMEKSGKSDEKNKGTVR